MKKYIKPAIIAKKVYFQSLFLAGSRSELQQNYGSTSGSTSEEEYNKEFDAKQHNIDLWADEVEREMAYGH